MEKYRFKGDPCQYSNYYMKGEVYNFNHTKGQYYMCVEEMAQQFPKDWELVEDEAKAPISYSELREQLINLIERFECDNNCTIKGISIDNSYLTGMPMPRSFEFVIE